MSSSDLDSTRHEAGEPKRKRGGQPGNKNALKHGFYAQPGLSALRESQSVDIIDPDQGFDHADLSSKSYPEDYAESLIEEITMLRVFMRRVVEESDRPLTHRELLDTLRVLSLAASSISRLVKIQELNLGGVEEIRRTISNAISKVAREMNIHL